MNKKDQYYMSLADVAAGQSKDPNTHVGSCLVKDGRVLSLGWNGAPRKFPDEFVPTSRDTSLPLKQQKYPYVVHSEINAVLNYGGSLRDLKGATLYVTVSPCCDCAKMLSQLEIGEVVYKEEYSNTETWEMSQYMFTMCGIKYRKLGE